MQVLITDSTLAPSRTLHFNGWQLGAALVALTAVLLLVASAVYHFVFLTAAREGWPVVSQIVKLVVRDETAQRDRFLRQNLDAMAQKVGEMQAKLLKLEAMGERVSGLAGVKPEEFKPLLRPGASASAPAVSAKAGQGGPFVPGLGVFEREALNGLNLHVGGLDERTDQTTDLFTLIESRLLEGRLAQLMVPSSAPVNGPVGSGFGFRSDPFSGRAALHTGLGGGHGGDDGAACGLWQPGRDRPRQRLADALRPRLEGDGQDRRSGQTWPTGGAGGQQRALDRPAPAL
jgi:hypothetical protein